MFWNRFLNFVGIKKKLAVTEKAAFAKEGDVTLHCSEQAGGTLKYTQVNKALKVVLNIMQINTCIPSAPSYESGLLHF